MENETIQSMAKETAEALRQYTGRVRARLAVTLAMHEIRTQQINAHWDELMAQAKAIGK
jgi:hypothetical protein